ncbi:MAG: hypothetical protein ABSC14_05700 [Desulfomonilia bacterium]
MRSDDEKRVIASTMLERIESMPQVTPATAPVFCLDRLKKPKFFASAVLLKVKNWHFALTAGHVLDERSFSDLYIGSGDKVVLLDGSFGTTVPPGTGDRQQDKIDIGIVRLSKETVQDMQEDEFLTLDDTYNLDTATTTGHYVFTGYPRSKHKRAIKEGQAEATPYSFAVVPAPLSDYQNFNLNPSISLLLRFDKQNLWRPSGRVEGPDPTGISGGGVWFLNNIFTTTPLRPLLVAIAIEKWKPPKPKRVLATKLHVALSVIWDRFPELRPYLPEPPHESKGD